MCFPVFPDHVNYQPQVNVSAATRFAYTVNLPYNDPIFDTPALADKVAGWWRCEGAVFNQVNKPVWRRDGILDAVYEDIAEALKEIDPDSMPSGSAPDMLDSFADSTVQREIG
ncbi:hypothetical protein B0T20DRAFT_481583 [Sordaria brevicollis]|uniref:Uncharacterized protein n=1 Tax=Sordaria brevicollis TaxID=83679 RepID=A0AAE0PB32_SORBR|nr:hypothetical protein B0T20DRAFT_481583 [Sordaria brevicollis]